MNRQEQYRERYRLLQPEWRDSLVRFRETVGEHVDGDTRVLDIGCGHADFLEPVYARTPHVVGLDPDLAALDRNTTIDRQVAGVAEALPFADETFDLCTAAWVLEHLDAPEQTFREIHRVLRPGGKFVFLTPNAWNYNVWLIRLIPNRVHGEIVRRLYHREPEDTYPVRYRANSVRALRREFSAAGFRRMRLLYNGDPSYISFNEPLFRLACGFEHVLDAGPLRRARVHIIGVAEK